MRSSTEPAPPARPGRVRGPGSCRPLRCAAAILAAGLPSLAAAQAPPQPPRFAVLEYRVQGNTVLPGLAVEEAVYPHLGPGRTADDIEKARAALEDAYARAGYPTVSVELPQQRVTAGIVTFRVVERPVGRLRVANARYFSPADIRREAPSLAEGRVPNLNAVQRDIVALNRIPDRRVTPELRAGAAPNTVDVDLNVQDGFPLHASVELNNRQSANTRELRTAASVRYDNLWQRGDSLNFGFQTAPQDPRNATVYSGSYLMRLPGERGASLLASFVRSDSNVATVGGSAVIGRGTIVGLRGIIPLGTGQGFIHTLNVGMDFKQFDEGLLLGADRTAVPVTYAPVSASWQGLWNGDRSTTQASATITAGLRGIGSDTVDFERKRAFANPSWMHLRGDVSHTQRLPLDFVAYGNVEGQLSRDALISNEQFAGGGLDSVRGYFEVETLGDYGVTGQLELRGPSLAPRLGAPFDEVRLHAFVDGGSLTLNRPLPQQHRTATLLSAGGGARMRLFGHVNGTVEGATVLRDGPLTPAGSTRALFRVWGEF